MPYKRSIAFIKAQTPGLTINELIRFYRGELEKQTVSSIIRTGANSIDFRNDWFKVGWKRYADKFSGFSSGQIKIVDEETQFVVYFEADIKRIFVNSAIHAGLMTIFALIFIKFNLFILCIGACAFAFGITLGYVSVYIFFPVYFQRLRNDIESVLQRGW